MLKDVGQKGLTVTVWRPPFGREAPAASEASYASEMSGETRSGEELVPKAAD